jgi:hypothetical protein
VYLKEDSEALLALIPNIPCRLGCQKKMSIILPANLIKEALLED